MDKLVDLLSEAGVLTVARDEPMANHTTWKIGGPADWFIAVRDREQLLATIRILQSQQVPWTVIGRGSNTLVTDAGIRGAVIKLEADFQELRFDGCHVHVGAAYSFIRLSVMAAKMGLTGLEFAGGIPGTVGGAVYMNAGAHGSDVARVLRTAELLLPGGEVVERTPEQLEFSYRHSNLQAERAIVLSAQFMLEYGDRKVIAAAMASYKERRQRTQPWQQPCAGSVFRNPEGTFAARLIEEAGLKGKSIGGAQISELHANFIVNLGDATARDVMDLIQWIQSEIERRTGIRLRPEVLIIGER